jgi:hypothetical protein
VIQIKIYEVEKLLKQEKQNFINLMPEQFKKRIEENAFLCGGCIYSLYNNQEPKDYDFFLKDNQLAKDLMEYFKSLELEPYKNLLQGKYKGLHLMITKYAISIGKYQIIIKYIGEPEDVVNQFDFKHNMFYFENENVKPVADWEFLDTNKISFNDDRARDICGVILRLPKFVKRGMIVTKKEIAKMLNKLNENGFDESEQEIIKYYSTY